MFSSRFKERSCSKRLAADPRCGGGNDCGLMPSSASLEGNTGKVEDGSSDSAGNSS